MDDDLVKALNEAALSDAFSALDSRNRYAILHWVQTAKRPDARARRIAKHVSMRAAGQKPIHKKLNRFRLSLVITESHRVARSLRMRSIRAAPPPSIGLVHIYVVV